MKRWLYAYRTVAGCPEQLDEALQTRHTDLLARAAGDDGSLHVDGGLALHSDGVTGVANGLDWAPDDAAAGARAKAR